MINSSSFVALVVRIGRRRVTVRARALFAAAGSGCCCWLASRRLLGAAGQQPRRRGAPRPLKVLFLGDGEGTAPVGRALHRARAGAGAARHPADARLDARRGADAAGARRLRRRC